MKNILKSIAALFAVAVLAVSCEADNYKYKEFDEDGNPLTKGTVSFAKLDISIDINVNTKSDISADNFTITLTNTKTSKVVGEWKKSEMPEVLTIYSGNYKLEAANIKTPKTVEWEQPHYYGSTTFVVTENNTTNVGPVVCKLSNASLAITYGSVFKNEMESWSAVAVTSGGSLTYAKAEARNGHFMPADIKITLTGVRKDGEPVSKVINITPVAAADAYAVDFNFTTSGGVKPSIEVDASVTNHDVKVTIDDDNIIIDPSDPDPDPTPDPDPDPTPDPTPAAPSIKGAGFDIKTPMTIVQGTTHVVDVNVSAEDGGINQLKVLIDSPELTPLLESMGMTPNLDLVNPTEKEKEFLISLGLITAEPIAGKKEFKFSIGAFTPLLPVGTHKFKVTLRDGALNTTEETLVIIVS